MKKVYVDAVELAKREILSVMMHEDYEIISAGTTVHSMEVTLKKDYQHYADYHDLHFIFDDAVPSVKYYTVPQVDIIARDSLGGFIGSIGQVFDIESDASICYINKDLEVFIIAENAKVFVQKIESWKKNLKPYNKISFYRFKKEAENELAFVSLPKGRIGEEYN